LHLVGCSWEKCNKCVVDKASLVHNLFVLCLIISTCLGWLCFHHQEKQLCLCNAWYVLFWNKWIV